MNDDPDDDFADWRNYPTQNPTPAAPKRPVKKGDVHTKVPSTSVLSTDNPYFEKSKTEECLICNKNITHLNEIRRKSFHTFISISMSRCIY
uniref:LITAF domain-containing protein n=1 Tax=Heterorhabditis bacteriophora TaxID=37862 RepID=A0A1I7W7A7_HETBA